MLGILDHVRRFFTVCLLLSLVIVEANASPTLIQVESVSFVGLERTQADALKGLLSHQQGSFSQSQISEDLKRLYRSGFFTKARVRYLAESKTLQYEVLEKPVVRKVFVRGNDELEQSDIEEVLDFDRETFFDQVAAKSSIEKILALYQKNGFYEAEVDYSTSEVSAGEIDLNFEIDEGEFFPIDEVRITGVVASDDDEILSFLETKPYSWWKSWILGTGKVEEEVLKIDRERIRQYLLDNGFLESSVSKAEVSVSDGELVVLFSIVEGPQYTISGIEVLGDLLDESEEVTLEGIESEAGELFSATQARDDAFRVSDNFGNYGFAFANVIPETRLNRKDALVDLVFRVEPGEKVRVDEITIEGNTKTYDKVIRRELRIQEQDQYNRRLVNRSRDLLQRLGYFEEVDITSSPTQSDDLVDLRVKVKEGRTGTFSAGAGFSSADGVLFNSRLSENNVFGTGRRMVFNVDFGDERNNFILSLSDRRIDDTYVSGRLDLLSTEREFTDFDRELSGASGTLAYPLEEWFGQWSEDMRVSLKYEYLDIDITSVDADAAPLVQQSEGTSTSSGFTPQLIRDTINNPINPTSGSRQLVSVEFTGLGGSEEYYLVELQNRVYFPLLERDWGDIVFAWRTRFGYGDTYDGDEFPLFRRFFPGGINSVRGFENRTLGPTDEDGNEFGGSKQFVNNFEFIFPLITSVGLRGVVFYDVGEAFDDDDSIRFSDLRQAVGYGIRWISPLGPLRVEFGFPLSREDGEDSNVTLFSFGAPL